MVVHVYRSIYRYEKMHIQPWTVLSRLANSVHSLHIWRKYICDCNTLQHTGCLPCSYLMCMYIQMCAYGCIYMYMCVCVSRARAFKTTSDIYFPCTTSVAACCSVLQNDIWHISSMHYAHIVTLPVQSKCPTYIELYISATHTFRHMSALTHVRKPSGLPMLEGYNFSKSQLATQLTVWNQ